MKTLAKRRKWERGAFGGFIPTSASGVLPSLLAAGLSLYAVAPRAEDLLRGRQLYENHCQACHSSLLHAPIKSQLKSYKELEARVTAWSVHAAKGWTDEEVRDVAYYLDRSFYHFGVRDE